jgi:heme/copper-type cytochrome/quinol oxidase subunit 3
MRTVPTKGEKVDRKRVLLWLLLQFVLGVVFFVPEFYWGKSQGRPSTETLAFYLVSFLVISIWCIGLRDEED